MDFDYKFLNVGCQYPVSAPQTIDGERDCGEAAITYGWWNGDYDNGMFLCNVHLQHILRCQEHQGEP